MNKGLIILFILLLIISCTPETITEYKYQCQNGRVVDSIDLCDEQKCQECPELDCSTCPKQIETKTITKYQCYDGTIKDKSADCPKTETQLAEEECPNLSEIKASDWKSIMGSTYLRLENSYNGKIIQGYEVSWSTYVQCEKGQKEGENINYWYCGKDPEILLDTIHLKKEVTDKEGTILEIINKKAYIILDEKLEYLNTICY